jgi:hypothetical protein
MYYIWKIQKDTSEGLHFERIDLCVNGEFDIISVANALSIRKVGALFYGKAQEGVIYRLWNIPITQFNHPYLTISEDIDGSSDLLIVKDFDKIRQKLRRKLKKGTGLEITISPARKLSASMLGKWFKCISEMYEFCRSTHCQFILSSGAESPYDMVSGPCFDAILKTAGIDPHNHWECMQQWLEAKLSKRISYA